MYLQATVDTIKGNFGFLSYEAEEGKKLFFHMSEVKGDGIIQAGDKVEFVVVHHQKTGKYSACSVVKIGYVKINFFLVLRLVLCFVFCSVYYFFFLQKEGFADFQNQFSPFLRLMQIWLKIVSVCMRGGG